ncbi:hypothetical protein KOR42_46800 [Thalassoglobus neptunius]|uniref:Uncharacterized protein n=1 Tax=Thalassoglobus neptunius TaxID=1938619 RepID=A0A5C5VW87_9PLAN|nr:hypothetical protein KOR42_46800 [Thalassoglobus neptunius]
MKEGASGQSHPERVLGRRVIETCTDCGGEGRVWGCDEHFTTHWAERCKLCNCVGYILDMPVDEPETDHSDVPF